MDNRFEHSTPESPRPFDQLIILKATLESIGESMNYSIIRNIIFKGRMSSCIRMD